jgi:hypothetical protein
MSPSKGVHLESVALAGPMKLFAKPFLDHTFG